MSLIEVLILKVKYALKNILNFIIELKIEGKLFL